MDDCTVLRFGTLEVKWLNEEAAKIETPILLFLDKHLLFPFEETLDRLLEWPRKHPRAACVPQLFDVQAPSAEMVKKRRQIREGKSLEWLRERPSAWGFPTYEPSCGADLAPKHIFPYCVAVRKQAFVQSGGFDQETTLLPTGRGCFRVFLAEEAAIWQPEEVT